MIDLTRPFAPPTEPAAPAPSAPIPAAIPAVSAAVVAAARVERAYPDDQPNDGGTEQNTAQDKQQTDAKAKTAEQAPTPAAEKVDTSDYQLQMPEGVQLDADLLMSAVPMLREAGISADQTNKLLPLVSQVQQRTIEQWGEQVDAHRSSTITEWKQQLKSDPEIGGDKLKESVRLAQVALAAGGATDRKQEVFQLLNESGLGDNPSFVRLFRNMGAEIERLRNLKGDKGETVKRESDFEVSRRRFQETVYPKDPPRRTWDELIKENKGKVAARRPRIETSYPDDQAGR